MTERWGWQPFAWEQNGLPTWRYRFAPRGLLTRRQMRAVGLAPGGAAPVAQIVWRHRRHEVWALLWDPAELVTKRVPTAAQLVAVSRALAARRFCPSCQRDVGYCIRRSLGCCEECAELQPAASCVSRPGQGTESPTTPPTPSTLRDSSASAVV